MKRALALTLTLTLALLTLLLPGCHVVATVGTAVTLTVARVALETTAAIWHRGSNYYAWKEAQRQRREYERYKDTEPWRFELDPEPEEEETNGEDD